MNVHPRVNRVVAAVLVVSAGLAAGWMAAAADGPPDPGSLDLTFDGDGIAVTEVFEGPGAEQAHAVAVQPDGRIVAAGFSESGAGRRFAVVRHRVDGSLDTSFDGDGSVTTSIGGTRDEGSALALQADGKIIVAGTSYVDGVPRFAVVRYRVDGSLDTSFDGDGIATTSIGGHSFAGAVALQDDGRIVVAGSASLPGTTGGGWVTLARYHPDGSLDTGFGGDAESWTPSGTFVTPVGNTSTAHAAAIGIDGSIVVAGSMRGGSTTDIVVVRYDASGAPDPTFGPVGTTRAGVVITDIDTALDVAVDVALQPDGGITVAGFSLLGSSVRMALVRYLDTGGIDPSFGDADGVVTPVIGRFSQALAVSLDDADRIVVAGDAAVGTDYDAFVARFLSDGTADPSFGTAGAAVTPVGTGNNHGRALALQADGRIVVVGYDDAAFNVVRYHGNAPPPPATHSLVAATAGPGAGSVTSHPAGIDCGSDCTEAYETGTAVELTATPGPQSVFTGWSGACTGIGECVVTMDADHSVVASFEVDDTAPDTTITAGPERVIRDITPTFEFTADEAGSSFQCSVDGAAYTTCTSPHTLGELATGRHEYAVRATDQAGNTDATAATAVFNVVPAPPPDPPPGNQTHAAD